MLEFSDRLRVKPIKPAKLKDTLIFTWMKKIEFLSESIDSITKGYPKLTFLSCIQRERRTTEY